MRLAPSRASLGGEAVSNDAMTTQTAALEHLVQDSLSESWDAFKKDAVLYILANLVATAVAMVSLGLLFAPLTVGLIGIVRKRRRGEGAAIGDVFGGFSSFGASFVAAIIIGLGVILGLILVVLPGLIFAFMCAFTFHGIAYRNLGSIDAIKASFGLVKSNFLAVAVIMLVAVVINAIGGLVWVGTLLTGPFTMVLITIAYEKLSATSA
jgi:uncharacterized membrane protein